MKNILITLSILATIGASAATRLADHLRTDGKDVQKAFASAAEAAQKCTVRVTHGSKQVLGTLVSKDGLIICKDSEFSTTRPSRIHVTFAKVKRLFRAKVVARDSEHDLVIIDINREVDPGFEWGDSEGLVHGTWLVAGTTDRPPKIGVRGGVLSANTREIKKAAAVIGVILGNGSKKIGGVQVRDIAKEGPAAKAGVKKNDVITAIDGVEVFETPKLMEIIKSHDPGTKLKVSIKRGDKKMTFNITLGYRTIVYKDMQSRNDKMSKKVSVRRTGFKSILQHDISLATTDMGGPLFDLKGRLVGINIAKANRVEFFAIPAAAIRQVLKDKADEIAKAREE
jgi:serine protease Do